MQYQYAGVMAEFGVSWEAFMADPDIITDSQFATAGASLTSTQVSTYSADGDAVDNHLKPMYEDPYRGLIDCWHAYQAMATRCRRISSSYGRAKCWAGAMECYAACVAAM